MGPTDEQVVAKLLESDGEAALSSMTQRFRSAFVDTTSPKYLPPFWKVDHKCEFTPACSCCLSGMQIV